MSLSLAEILAASAVEQASQPTASAAPTASSSADFSVAVQASQLLAECNAALHGLQYAVAGLKSEADLVALLARKLVRFLCLSLFAKLISLSRLRSPATRPT